MPKVSRRPVDLLSLLAKIVFGLSILAALGVVGYKFYLNYSIKKMSAALEAARTAISPEVVQELLDINDRLSSAKELVESHRVLSPVFAFLESSTPKAVRFSQFNFVNSAEGPQILLRGEALSYAALALEADIIYKAKSFRNPVFSDIRLDERGNVAFSLKADLDKNLLSYKNIKITPVPAAVQATSSATTTRP